MTRIPRIKHHCRQKAQNAQKKDLLDLLCAFCASLRPKNFFSLRPFPCHLSRGLALIRIGFLIN